MKSRKIQIGILLALFACFVPQIASAGITRHIYNKSSQTWNWRVYWVDYKGQKNKWVQYNNNTGTIKPGKHGRFTIHGPENNWKNYATRAVCMWPANDNKKVACYQIRHGCNLLDCTIQGYDSGWLRLEHSGRTGRGISLNSPVGGDIRIYDGSYHYSGRAGGCVIGQACRPYTYTCKLDEGATAQSQSSRRRIFQRLDRKPGHKDPNTGFKLEKVGHWSCYGG